MTFLHNVIPDNTASIREKRNVKKDSSIIRGTLTSSPPLGEVFPM